MARDVGKPTGISEVRIPLAQLLPDPANVRLHPERNRKAVRASLTRFGAARSIVADGNLIVRAGNATLAEAAAAGIKTARVIRAHGDELIVVQRDDWDDTQATAYAIADNKATDESEFDPRALGLTLAALPEEEREATGFDAEELAALVGTAEPEDEEAGGVPVEDPAGEWGGMPAFEQQDKSPHQSIHVHFRNDDDVREFAGMVGQKISDKTKWIWYPKLENLDQSRNRYAHESEISGLCPDEGEA